VIRALAAVLAAGLAAQAAAAGTHAVLLPGTYHADEVGEAAAGEWGAVCGGGASARLESARVTVTPVFDEVRDTSAAARTGRQVEVSGCSDLVFLVRGVPGESRALAAAPPAQDAGESRATAFGGQPLRVSRTTSPETVALSVEWGAASQPLAVVRAGGAARFELRWAGDLDGDGRPDLLLGLWDESSARTLRLFLSAPSEDGPAAWREAAVFRTADS
jgi:hypothetical protein